MKTNTPTKKQILEQMVFEAKDLHTKEQAALKKKHNAVKSSCAALVVKMIKEGKITSDDLEVDSYGSQISVGIEVGNRKNLKKALDRVNALPYLRRFNEQAARRRAVASLNDDVVQEIRKFFSLPQTKAKIREML